MIETQYARSGDVHIAYQVLGDGPVDLIFDWGNSISITDHDAEPRFARFMDRLTELARVIRYDVRGVGMSDSDTAEQSRTQERDVADLTAVMDAAGAQRPLVFGVQSGAVRGLVAAGLRPDRIDRLVLWHPYARLAYADDYPIGFPKSVLQGFLESATDPSQESVTPGILQRYAPSGVQDRSFITWWEEGGRRGAGPAAAREQRRFEFETDIRDVLPQVDAEALVLARSDSRWLPLDHSRYVAEHLPNGRLVELPGGDIPPFLGDVDAVFAALEDFVGGGGGHRVGNRTLATVLFTDIVGSTEEAARRGDSEWALVLDRHDELVRRQIARFEGVEVNTTGDGFVAVFERPAQGVRCGVAITNGVEQLGLRVRAGLHTGEIERRGDDVGGLAVHVGQRISALAGPGEVLVSRTVKDLVIGSGLEFEDRGAHALKGVPDEWQVFVVV